MNFLFAMVIYIGILYAWGEEFLPTENAKYGIEVNEVGEKIGFQNGDKILTVDNQYVENFNKIIPMVVLDNIKTVQVERNGQKVDVEISDSDLALLLKSKAVMAPRIPFELIVESFKKNSLGEAAGLLVNDKLVGLNGDHFDYLDEWIKVKNANIGIPVVLNIERQGQHQEIPVTFGEDGSIGVVHSLISYGQFLEYKTIKYGFFESIPAGIKRGVQTTGNYLKQFKLFFRPETKAYESLGGFATIGNIFPGTWDWFSFWNMTAFISIILAIMNLLPIPALDGGHVMFLMGEMITGRKPNEKFLEYAQIVGMILLLALVLYANANDILKMINGTF